MSKKKTKVIELLKTTFLSRNDIAKKINVSPSYITKVANELGEAELSAAFQKKMENYRLELVELLRDKISKFNLDDDKFMLQLHAIQRLCKMMGWEQAQRIDVSVNIPTQIVYNVTKPEDPS